MGRRVLVIDEELPWPLHTGKRIRTFQLLRRLAGAFDILFVYHERSAPPEGAREAFEEAGIALRPVPRPPLRKQGVRFLADLARNVFLPVPYMVMAHRSRALRTVVGELVAAGRVDLVHAEWTPLVANVPADVNVPVCVAAHNVEAQIWDRYRQQEHNPARRAYIALQARKVARFEQAALAGADAVVAVSDADAERIRTWGRQSNVVVAPNGVDTDSHAPRPDAEVRPGSCLFVGALDWRPNLDGLTWFLDAVWPRVRERRPDATLTIVGRSPPEGLRQRLVSHEGVDVAADVPDVRPYVASAAVSVVPLRIGGGSRLKISEALAMQRPVVSTSVGAEGLDLGDGILLADDALAFAAAIGAVFEDSAKADAMAARGRERVLARYAWDVIAPVQAALWDRLARAGSRA